MIFNSSNIILDLENKLKEINLEVYFLSDYEKIIEITKFLFKNKKYITELNNNQKQTLINKLLCIYYLNNLEKLNSNKKHFVFKKDDIIKMNIIDYIHINFSENIHKEFVNFQINPIFNFLKNICPNNILIHLNKRLYKFLLYKIFNYPFNSITDMKQFLKKKNFKNISIEQVKNIIFFNSNLFQDQKIFNIFNNTIRLFYSDLTDKQWDYENEDFVYSQDLFEILLEFIK